MNRLSSTVRRKPMMKECVIVFLQAKLPRASSCPQFQFCDVGLRLVGPVSGFLSRSRFLNFRL